LLVVMARGAVLFCIGLLVAATFARDYDLEFRQFMKSYGKNYKSSEFQQKFRVFKQNLRIINKLNNDPWHAGATFGVNAFADLTTEEFSARFTGYNASLRTGARNEAPITDALPSASCPPASSSSNSASNGASNSNSNSQSSSGASTGASSASTGAALEEYLDGFNAAPVAGSSCDWRNAGVVTAIKNQGQCGDCWAFSAVASTEGAHALSTGNLVSLSEQNLCDCSTAEGNNGCNGGLMDYAFKYVISNGGIDTEASYPYTGVQGSCHYSAGNSGATLSSYRDIPTGSETDLTTAIGSVGPISVAIDASHSSFQFYTGGVYYEAACSSTQLDHGVTAVGYGVQGSSDFYIVKNSWGTAWGISGYILMSRNRDNNCGIATDASYPIV